MVISWYQFSNYFKGFEEEWDNTAEIF